MKKKAKAKGDTEGVHIVRIEFHNEEAAEVFIAGTFNDWSPASAPMIRLEKGRWVKELSLPAGRYEYRLVVDGQWLCDSRAAERVTNPFGDYNAVLIVPSIQSDAAKNHHEEN